MGRHAQPIDLLEARGKKHLTKAEIQQRKESEIKLGTKELDKLKPPAFVKNDVAAFSYWKQHLKEYKAAATQGIEILTSSDVGMLALYCKTYSEYERLQRGYQAIDQAYDHNAFAAMEALIKMETAINKKMDMLIKMQDRLFLNPLAKVKNVPKPKKEEKPMNKFAKFTGGRK